MMKHILSVLVQNNSGVLARVSSLFGRRGFNIESLTVSATTNPAISRMSIIVTGDEPTLEQIIKQVSKLEETIWVRHLQEDDSYCRELVFVKLLTDSSDVREAIRQIADLYGARIVESTGNTIIVELTEVPSRIDAFLDVISNFEVLEMCRSGVTAIQK
ncbi:MAG: acetolactate synthase small subunit [Agathobaculum sp.]|uniref:acetolactate synthase small subunit n=1 Tax=Agathobaculum sp. TaxID=2048138 RepID=UPI0025C562AC|nr:acetolactate synthase small subunit [Agathobaculum sp.]MCI7124971.1 acetolactate synthase small subunit [Agathobaculum sp.]MDY3711259.1 acetolactate synthase small subunit [Agathobaculum sp.]